MAKSDVKTRFAPSPTGLLHVGGLRTALFNFLWARKNNGRFLIRIEDTDQARRVAGADQEIIDTLDQFGLNFDNSPVYQSERLSTYKQYADELIKQGLAFGDEGAIRQKIPKQGSTEFTDEVFGKIKVENHTLDQGVLLKSDGFPTYNFANVIDDHEMGITHVLRGEEFIPSTPKHILLYKAFAWEPPRFVHLPLILDKQKKKLSKRTGDVAVQEYLDLGYHKEALLNFIALLGWNPKTKREVFDLGELIKQFELKKINKAGAVFDTDKLNHINSEWSKKLGPSKVLQQRIVTQMNVPPAKHGWVSKYIAPLIVDRMKGPDNLKEALPEFTFFFSQPDYQAKLLVWKDTSKKQTRKNLKRLSEFIKKHRVGEWGKEKLEKEVKDYLEEEGIPTGEALWPLRVALTGLDKSPGPFEIIYAFCQLRDGKQEVLERIETAIEKIK